MNIFPLNFKNIKLETEYRNEFKQKNFNVYAFTRLFYLLYGIRIMYLDFHEYKRYDF